MKKIIRHWYSIEKIIHTDSGFKYYKDPNGYLFANRVYKTKIKAEDLPEYFVNGRFSKCWGYMSSKGVVDMLYRPNLVFNHFLKDDLLFISYNNKIDQSLDNISLMYKSDIYFVDGNDILQMLKAIKRYSNYDISKIIVQLKDKLNWFKDNYPEDYKNISPNFNIDDYFNKK